MAETPQKGRYRIQIIFDWSFRADAIFFSMYSKGTVLTFLCCIRRSSFFCNSYSHEAVVYSVSLFYQIGPSTDSSASGSLEKFILSKWLCISRKFAVEYWSSSIELPVFFQVGWLQRNSNLEISWGKARQVQELRKVSYNSAFDISDAYTP